MDASSSSLPPRAEGEQPPERKGSPRPAAEGRRRRPAEQRYVGWGDSLDRVFCALAEHALPTKFPVASHAGVAVIAPAVVARRPDALLLCTFTHCGAHVWPDGEVADDSREEATTATP